MLRRSRSGTPMSVTSSGEGYIEERSKTFIIKQASEMDGASGYCSPIDACDMERMVDLVNRKLNSKEKQIKKEMREEFELRFAKDKHEQEETIRALKKDLSALSKFSGDGEDIVHVQNSLRSELNEQRELVQALKQENKVLKSNESKIEQLMNENRNLKGENDTLNSENLKLQFKVGKMEAVISDKEKEIESMKTLIESQYKRLKLDLTNTRDKFHTDQGVIQEGMKKQQVMLAEISEVVKAIPLHPPEFVQSSNTVPNVKTKKGPPTRQATDYVPPKNATVDKTKTLPNSPTQSMTQRTKNLPMNRTSGPALDKSNEKDKIHETPAKVKRFSTDTKTMSNSTDKRNQKLVAEIKVEKVQGKTRTGLVRR